MPKINGEDTYMKTAYMYISDGDLEPQGPILCPSDWELNFVGGSCAKHWDESHLSFGGVWPRVFTVFDVMGPWENLTAGKKIGKVSVKKRMRPMFEGKIVSTEEGHDV